MTTLQTIRYYFDIGNASLANYFGISVAMMNSISNGRRVWACRHLEGLLRLSKALELETPPDLLEKKADFTQSERQTVAELTTGVIVGFEKDLKRKREQLDKLKHTRMTILRGLHACEGLLSTDLSPHEERWVLLRQKHLQGKLSEKNLGKIWLLQAEVCGLEAKTRHLKIFLTELIVE